MIKLPQYEGMYIRDAINKYRRKNNIPEPKEIRELYNKNDTFLEKELQYITKLRITDDILPYLDYFPNLINITIDGEHGLSQKDIKDVIHRYPNLKELTIIGQKELQTLDIRTLTELQDLKLVSNYGLKRIIGIENLNNLYSFTFYDNRLYNDKPKQELIEQVCKIITENGAECNLDVLYMPDVIKYLNDSHISLDLVSDYMRWSEQLKAGVKNDHLEYKTRELYVAYQRAVEVVNRYIKSTDTAEQKYAIIYQWMCENVKYASAALANNRTQSLNGIVQGRSGGINGTVNAFVYRSSVCQGYTKAMQMLLAISGIYSVDIGCMTSERKVLPYNVKSYDGKILADESDHSILKVNLDQQVSYSDVTWDAARYQNGKERIYFLLSKDDISKNHKLIGEESTFISRTFPRGEQDVLLKFARNRIQSVDMELKINRAMQQQKIIISQAEKLLSIKITDSKDTKDLLEKQKNMFQQLDNLFYDGTLDISVWRSMKKAIRVECDKIIALKSEYNKSVEVEPKGPTQSEILQNDSKSLYVSSIEDFFKKEELDKIQRDKNMEENRRVI